MQFNFSLKKAWKDLFGNKQYVLEFSSMLLLMIVLYSISIFTEFKLLPILGYFIWIGYLSLMCNNVINGREPVLADIFSNAEGRNIFVVSFKFISVGTIYGLVFGIIGGLICSIFPKLFSLPAQNVLIATAIILLPLMMLFSLLSGFLFSENLKFSEGFNLKKIVNSYKAAWKDYLATFGIFILMYLSSIVVIILVVTVFAVLILGLSKAGMPLDSLGIHNYSKVFGQLIGNLLGFPMGYLFNHIVAQTYKYSLTKIVE